ncbi:IS3 family transposase [Streptomyces sp. 8L]|uniref:IS3 family transposase n=1 Tax=Streptomyces sp. 8L TaxID=2877242 RepID=UPI001CD73258|nr:IS3 family transposase [Streptomyces sp. 8L]
MSPTQRRYGVKRLCSVLGVARSSFYYWRRTAKDRAARQAVDARPTVRTWAVHQESDGTYGVPRITAELRETGGEAVNHKRVARIMRASGVEGVRLRRRHRTTVPDPAVAKAILSGASCPPRSQGGRRPRPRSAFPATSPSGGRRTTRW